jgi:hypothetical protein
MSPEAARASSPWRGLDSRNQVRRLPYAGAPAKRTPCHLHTAGLRLDAALPDDRRCAPYRSERTESWIKVKCGKRGTFPIIAFVEKLGAKPRRIASFYVGRREGDRLLYAGKVRGGFTEAEARDLRERLDPFIRKESPLAEPVNKPKATWVEPVLEADVAYSTLTETTCCGKPCSKAFARTSKCRPRPPRYAGYRAQRAAAVRPACRARTSCSSCRMRGPIERGTRRVLGKGLEAGSSASRAPAAQARAPCQRHDVLP